MPHAGGARLAQGDEAIVDGKLTHSHSGKGNRHRSASGSTMLAGSGRRAKSDVELHGRRLRIDPNSRMLKAAGLSRFPNFRVL